MAKINMVEIIFLIIFILLCVTKGYNYVVDTTLFSVIITHEVQYMYIF